MLNALLNPVKDQTLWVLGRILSALWPHTNPAGTLWSQFSLTTETVSLQRKTLTSQRRPLSILLPTLQKYCSLTSCLVCVCFNFLQVFCQVCTTENILSFCLCEYASNWRMCSWGPPAAALDPGYLFSHWAWVRVVDPGGFGNCSWAEGQETHYPAGQFLLP